MKPKKREEVKGFPRRPGESDEDYKGRYYLAVGSLMLTKKMEKEMREIEEAMFDAQEKQK